MKATPERRPAYPAVSGERRIVVEREGIKLAIPNGTDRCPSAG